MGMEERNKLELESVKLELENGKLELELEKLKKIELRLRILSYIIITPLVITASIMAFFEF